MDKRLLSVFLLLLVGCSEPDVVVQLPTCQTGEHSLITMCDDKEDDHGLRTCTHYDLCHLHGVNEAFTRARENGICIPDDSMGKLLGFLRAAYRRTVTYLWQSWTNV